MALLGNSLSGLLSFSTGVFIPSAWTPNQITSKELNLNFTDSSSWVFSGSEVVSVPNTANPANFITRHNTASHFPATYDSEQKAIVLRGIPNVNEGSLQSGFRTQSPFNLASFVMIGTVRSDSGNSENGLFAYENEERDYIHLIGDAEGSSNSYAISFDGTGNMTGSFRFNGDSNLEFGPGEDVALEGFPQGQIPQQGTYFLMYAECESRTVDALFFRFRNGNSSFGYKGELTYLLAFNQPLTDEDRDKCEGYIAHISERTNLLPATHPYKSSPPT